MVSLLKFPCREAPPWNQVRSDRSWASWKAGLISRSIPKRHEESTDERVKVEWVVKAKKGTKVKLLAKHDRAGVVRAEVVLE